MSNLARVVDRLRQASEAIGAGRSRASAGADSAEARLGLMWRPGMTAIDVVTGQPVEVVHGTRESVILPAADRGAR